jgi:hypothetical protein
MSFCRDQDIFLYGHGGVIVQPPDDVVLDVFPLVRLSANSKTYDRPPPGSDCLQFVSELGDTTDVFEVGLMLRIIEFESVSARYIKRRDSQLVLG